MFYNAPDWKEQIVECKKKREMQVIKEKEERVKKVVMGAQKNTPEVNPDWVAKSKDPNNTPYSLLYNNKPTNNTLFPSLIWAQRQSCILLTITVPDLKHTYMDIDESTSSLLFTGENDNGTIRYSLNLPLYKGIVKKQSRWNFKGRFVIFNIAKKSKIEEDWPRLQKDNQKN